MKSIDPLNDLILGSLEACSCAVDKASVSLVHLIALGACNSFDSAHTCSNRAFAHDANHAETACAACMTTTTELYRSAKLNHTYLVAILLAKECYSAQFLCFLQGSVSVFLKGEVLTNALVDDVLYLANLLRSNLLKVREVKAQIIWSNQRALLLYVLAQYATQCLVK